MTVAFNFRGEFVGTIRAVPLGHGITLTETLMRSRECCTQGLEGNGWEMGRLVMTPSFRGETVVLRHCLFLALDYLSSKAQVSTLFAACTPVLARLYRRFGFSEMERNVLLPGTDKAYSLIMGPFAAVLDALTPSPAAGVRMARYGDPEGKLVDLQQPL